MGASDEAILSEALLEWFLKRPGSIIHAWHPPSSKAYFGPLVRIPRKRDGVRIRERYHLDGVVQLGECLLLVELKGSSTGLDGDQHKLKELMQQYSLSEFLTLLRLRVKDTAALENVLHWAPAFGYKRGPSWKPDMGVVFSLSGKEIEVCCLGGEHLCDKLN